MSKLRFLKVIKSKDDGNDVVHISMNKKLDFPRSLRLLHWEAYPGKRFPRTFNLEYLVELNMKGNRLEKLWEGPQPLRNLKRLDLSGSLNLKELPDLSKATTLEKLVLNECSSLEEIPHTIRDLHKLEELDMDYCTQLQVVPTHLNLASLNMVGMIGCSQMRRFPHISKNITELSIAYSMLGELPDTVSFWSRLESLHIYGDLGSIDLCADKLPEWIKDLDGLHELFISDLPKVASLPEFPNSLRKLTVIDCESLVLIAFPSDSEIKELSFPNCLILSGELRRFIAQNASLACLPATKMPVDLDHQAIGNSLTIRSDSRNFRVCALVYPEPHMLHECRLYCCIHINGCRTDTDIVWQVHLIETEHIFISNAFIGENQGWLEQGNKISFQFITSEFAFSPSYVDVMECGVKIMPSEEKFDECSVNNFKKRKISLMNPE